MTIPCRNHVLPDRPFHNVRARGRHICCSSETSSGGFGRSKIVKRVGRVLLLTSTKETKLERADFQAGWSELSWPGRALPILA